MSLISGNIGGVDFKHMLRGYFYKLSYINMQSGMKKPLIVNPIMVFSAIDSNSRIHGLDIRVLRNPYVFLEDYEKFYCVDGTIRNMQPEHPHAFSFRILKALFLRNPDIEAAWRIYNPLYMKNIQDINIEDTIRELKYNKNKVHTKEIGVI
jgi:hypothetical protein